MSLGFLFFRTLMSKVGLGVKYACVHWPFEAYGSYISIQVFVLVTWAGNIVLFSSLEHVCMSVYAQVGVVVSQAVTICASLTLWSGKALRPAAHSALCWNPGKTVCLTQQ